jgi:hypothetical protein
MYKRYIITYVPNSSTELEIEEVEKRFKEYASCIKINETTWCIKTKETASSVWSSVKHWLHPSAYVYVFGLDASYCINGPEEINNQIDKTVCK